jgi:hypothetical protein
VTYLFPLAEKELRAFVHAIDQLFGTEQARRSALDWIHEMEVHELVVWRSNSQLAARNDSS